MIRSPLSSARCAVALTVPPLIVQLTYPRLVETNRLVGVFVLTRWVRADDEVKEEIILMFPLPPHRAVTLRTVPASDVVVNIATPFLLVSVPLVIVKESVVLVNKPNYP